MFSRATVTLGIGPHSSVSNSWHVPSSPLPLLVGLRMDISHVKNARHFAQTWSYSGKEHSLNRNCVHMLTVVHCFTDIVCIQCFCLLCSDTVGLASGRASGL